MEIYKPMSSKELSQRKIEEYEKMSKIIQWGRKCPVRYGQNVVEQAKTH